MKTPAATPEPGSQVSAVSSQILKEELVNRDQLPLLRMSLRIARGPLRLVESEEILGHYNRLTGSQIPLDEYLRWVQNSPDGPAWHAILQNDSLQIVGHSAVIPLRGHSKLKRIVAGKAEYAFVLEEYRTAKIRGFEQSGRPRNAIMIQQLFRRWQQEGLGPLLISTSEVRQRSLSGVGCSVAKFPVTECLLVLRPWNAARATPNLRGWQRWSLAVAGILQKAAWLGLWLLPGTPKVTEAAQIQGNLLAGQNDRVSFFEDLESLKWRYLEGQYERIELDSGSEWVIAKKGSGHRYHRVCQWGFETRLPSFRLIAKLVRLAKEENALGVRWAVYGNDKAAEALSRRLRRLGFLCARRTRSILIFSDEREFLSADMWKLTDAMFGFDP